MQRPEFYLEQMEYKIQKVARLIQKTWEEFLQGMAGFNLLMFKIGTIKLPSFKAPINIWPSYSSLSHLIAFTIVISLPQSLFFLVVFQSSHYYRHYLIIAINVVLAIIYHLIILLLYHYCHHHCCSHHSSHLAIVINAIFVSLLFHLYCYCARNCLCVKFLYFL